MEEMSLNEIPALLLNLNERLIISQSMDQRLIKEIEDTHLPRDYRGLGQLMGIQPSFIREAEEKKTITDEMLVLWGRNENNSIGKLIGMFETLGRYDVIDDLLPILVQRIPDMIRRLKKRKGEKSISSQMKIVSRREWGAIHSRMLKPLSTPADYVIIHHTGKYEWEGYFTIQKIQEENMRKLGASDIIFNFLINQEGIVFEGSGWNQISGNTYKYNSFSLIVGLLGDFENEIPSKQMMDSLKEFIQLSIDMGHLNQDYSLYGFRDVALWCQSPGKNALDIISKWPRYRAAGELLDTEDFRSGLGTSAERNKAEEYFKSKPEEFISHTLMDVGTKI